jgi:hypothetical protein
MITKILKDELLVFLHDNRKADLVSAYLFYLEKRFDLQPVLFPKEKKIYKSLEDLIYQLEKRSQLYRETEIKIQFGKDSVNEDTKKIYICPHTGKVFGDNTCHNPQDAIYDWVSRCPENTENDNGMKIKRFYVSEDPKIIKNYITKRKEPISKTVYSSAVSGKLFNSKEAIFEDFKKSHIKYLTIQEVQNQNRFEIEQSFLDFLQEHLKESEIQKFVEELSKHAEFESYLEKWLR